MPALLLQPLVENALRHGIELFSNPGLVRVVVKRQDRRLVLSVEDNGVGLSGTGNPPGSGIGLSNLRARLEALYGAEQKVELVARPEGGVAVRVEIPARESECVSSEGASSPQPSPPEEEREKATALRRFRSAGRPSISGKSLRAANSPDENDGAETP